MCHCTGISTCRCLTLQSTTSLMVTWLGTWRWVQTRCPSLPVCTCSFRKVFKLKQVQESEPSFQEEMFVMSYVLITDLDLREYAGRTILQSAHHQTHQFYCSQDSVLPELESTWILGSYKDKRFCDDLGEFWDLCAMTYSKLLTVTADVGRSQLW
jgi:hypothetical protein